ncbi:hypothetical protein KOM00_17985 [Geomonas sp. Red69]|uniref:Uncharacterized protein n=1 Tax=Geomonas diazotrophica TaxID=2843197 RepID=A0ABX8JKC2_9BACT|nr:MULTISPECIES: hypothetical protein [Geomonas]MBU5638621.1 hypothetical protein [Geomonas diazotrophica]QWV97107.1 hypothetical protein KP005_17450 [Geomonas nitrogeniifigens]QXE86279.1 hypothetical protein KP003_18265 [Geomonas nitrogeniifigens]
MSYSVDRISGGLRVDPDAGGQEHQRRRGKSAQKSEPVDSVSISEEAKKLLEKAEAEGASE